MATMHNLRQSPRSLRWLLTFSLLLGWHATSAWAAPNDIHLHFLYNGRVLGNNQQDQALKVERQKMFQNLSAEMGFSLAEPILSPAESLGSAGFDIGIQFTVANIPELKGHWRRAVEDERPDNELFLTRLRFRKGLPLSFEIEGSVTFISGSTSFLAGVGLKWALIDGFFYFPDLAVRSTVNYMFGTRDLVLLNTTVDVILSKQIPIVGTFTITPYAAYSLVYTYGNSQVLDPTPKNFDDNEDAQSGASNFVFTPEHILGSRLSFGARFVWYFMSLTLEGAFVIPHFDGPETISLFNTKISFFF